MCIAPAASLLAQQTKNTPPPPAAGEAPIGKYLLTIAGLDEPMAAVVAPDDSIYVVDRAVCRVVVAGPDGKILSSFGKRGGGAGELLAPCGIAMHPDGELYVADTGNHRIQVFSADGHAVRTIGRRGAAAGEFFAPIGLAFDGKDHLQIADSGNDRVQVITLDGKPIRSYGALAGGGTLRAPTGVTVATDGGAFVVDANTPRVFHFDAGGKLAGAWGEYGVLPAFLGTPLAVGPLGDQLLLTDVNNHRVQVFDASGKVLYDWGVHAIEPMQGKGRVHYPNFAAAAPSGRFVVVCEAWEGRCQVFGRVTGPEDDLSYLRVGMEQAAAHYGERVSASGVFMAMTEPETHQVQIFNTTQPTPINITTLGGYGEKFGQFVHPCDVDLDAKAGSLWVIDSGNRRLVLYRLKLDPQAEIGYSLMLTKLVKSIPFDVLTRRVMPGKLEWPVQLDAIQRGPDGRLYAVDSRNAVVLMFGEKMEIERVIAGPGGEPGKFRRPVDVAISSKGRIVVADADAQRVDVFDSIGRHTAGWSVRGEDEPTSEPFGVGISKEDTIYVTDRGLHRVTAYDLAGKQLARWGKAGLGAAEFRRPAGVVCDDRGRVLVIDFGNHRAQYFDASGKFLDVFGARWFKLPALKRQQQ
ncbi:MAG: NHL repeat-containing protein [Phycisphaerae bacterium]